MLTVMNFWTLSFESVDFGLRESRIDTRNLKVCKSMYFHITCDVPADFDLKTNVSFQFNVG